jgi:hypothetical protein
MKRRGKRIAFTVAATGLAVLLVLVVAHWGTVRDHVEAWWFQLTRETETIEPGAVSVPTAEISGGIAPGLRGAPPAESFSILTRMELRELLGLLATHSGRPMTYDPADPPPEAWWLPHVGIVRKIAADYAPAFTRADPMGVLGDSGYRVLEQRFPRHAYVLIRDQGVAR